MNEISENPGTVLDHADQAQLQQLAQYLDKTGAFPKEAFDLIARNRHFHLFVPEERGGLDIPLVEGMRIIEAYAAIEGNLGWIVQIGAGGGIFAAYLDEEVANRFLGQPDQVIAGSDFVGGEAIPVEEGYRVTGQWAYASGAMHATAFTGGCRIASGPREGLVRAMIVPSDEVTIIPHWNAMGMRATDSHSFRVDDLLVPESHLFSLSPEDINLPTRTASLPFLLYARALFLPVLTGETHRYFNLYKDYITGRSYEEGSTAAVALHHLEQVWEALRGELFQLSAEIWSEIESGPVAASQDKKFAELGVRMTDELLLAVDKCHRHTGMTGIRMDEAVNISYRNIKTVAAHQLLNRPSLNS